MLNFQVTHRAYIQFIRESQREWRELSYVHFWDKWCDRNYQIAMSWAHPEPAD